MQIFKWFKALKKGENQPDKNNGNIVENKEPSVENKTDKNRMSRAEERMEVAWQNSGLEASKRDEWEASYNEIEEEHQLAGVEWQQEQNREHFKEYDTKDTHTPKIEGVTQGNKDKNLIHLPTFIPDQEPVPKDNTIADNVIWKDALVRKPKDSQDYLEPTKYHKSFNPIHEPVTRDRINMIRAQANELEIYHKERSQEFWQRYNHYSGVDPDSSFIGLLDKHDDLDQAHSQLYEASILHQTANNHEDWLGYLSSNLEEHWKQSTKQEISVAEEKEEPVTKDRINALREQLEQSSEKLWEDEIQFRELHDHYERQNPDLSFEQLKDRYSDLKEAHISGEEKGYETREICYQLEYSENRLDTYGEDFRTNWNKAAQPELPSKGMEPDR